MRSFNLLIAFLFFIISCETTTTSESPTQKIIKTEDKVNEATSERVDSIDHPKFRFLWRTNAWTASTNYYLKNTLRKKDILGYYSVLPPFLLKRDWAIGIRHFENELVPSSLYKESIQYKNVDNGYIRAFPSFSREDTAVSSIEIALFTSQIDTFIVVAYSQEGGVGLFSFKEQQSYKNSFDLADTWENVNVYNTILPELNLEGKSVNLFFKLPEYGTTILACKSEQEFLEDPDTFWEEMEQNHPERIIELAWDVEKGKFYIKE
ncbi:MAG: hypothetical protein AAF734_07265 [Bacteroidota bacterium]